MAKRGRKKNYKGRCFEAAFDAAVNEAKLKLLTDNDEYIFIIHYDTGIVGIHSWCELAGKWVIDLTKQGKPFILRDYYEIGKVDESRLIRYPLKEYCALMIQNNNYGPFQDFPGVLTVKH